jgi:RNA polymerase sigma factor (sigma-70 family)
MKAFGFFTACFASWLAACSVAPAGPTSEGAPTSAPITVHGPAETEGPFQSCLRELAVEEEGRVAGSLMRRYRLSPDDARDLVRDAMLSVCLRHATGAYRNVGAALQMAAENTAKDGWRRRRRYRACPIDETIPSCAPLAAETTRFTQELRAVEAALCKLDGASERIVKLRVIEDMDFATIGREVGLSESDARYRFHNKMRWVKAQLAQACRLGS